MLRFRRVTVAILILMTSWPTLVFGQAASKAGIVTTLEGRATAARVVLPQPVPLHFKDDVFLNDEITTAEKSLARILLGGKAVVTVRERSSLTITEVPGLSTIDIASGKIAMAVARERLRPGEQIQIRTPNAITGIRGTSLIVEVIRSVADTKQPDANVITRLGVFNGNVDVQHINPITKAPLAPPINVAINTKFSAAGTQPAAVAAFAPGDAASFQQGVTPAGPQHVQAANEQALAVQAQETANALLTALATGAVVAAPLVPTSPSTVDTRPELNDDKSTELSCAEQPSQPGCQEVVVQVPPPPRPPVLVGVPSNITLDPALAPFLGSTGTSVVEIPSGTSRITTAGNAIEVDTSTPTPAELTIPLLTAIDGDLDVRGHLLNVLGTLASTTTESLIGLDPTTLSVAGDLVRVGPGALLSVAGRLVGDNSGMLTIGGNLIAVEPGGELVSRSDRPLVDLDESNVTVGGSLIRIDGGSAYLTGSAVEASDARVTANSLLEVRGFAHVVTGDTTDPLFEFRDGADMTVARGIVFNGDPGAVLRVDGDLVRLSDSRLAVSGSLVDMNAGLRFTSNLVARVEDESTLTVGGPLVRLTGGSQFGANVLLVSDGSGNQIRLGGLLDISDSTAIVGQLRSGCGDCRFQDVVTWTLGLNQPLIRLTNGQLAVTDASTAIRREGFDEGLALEPGVTLISTATGPARGSVITVPNGTLFGFGGVLLSDPNPQLQLGNSDVGAGNALIRVFQESRAAGPLLDAVGSLLVTERNELLGIYAPLLVDGSGQALLRFADSSVITGTEIVLIGGNGHLQLGRGLVDAVDTPFVTQAFDTFVTIAEGGRLSAATASPLISLTNSPVTMQLGEDFIHVGSSILGGDGRAALSLTGGGSLVRLAAMDFALTSSGALLRVTDSDVTLGGPILEAVNANLTFDGPVAYVANSGRLTTTAGPAFKVTGGSLTADSLIGTDGEGNVVTFTGTVADLSNTTVTLNRAESAFEPIIVLSGGANVPLLRMASSTLTLNDSQPLFDFGVDDGTPIVVDGVAMIATGTPAAPSRLNIPSLLDLGGVAFTDTNPQIQLTRTVVNQTLPGSLITVFGQPVITAGPLLSANFSTFNLLGSLFDVGDGDLIADGDGVGAFVQLFASTLTSPADLVRIGEAFVSLDRGLLDAIDSTFTTGGGALVAVDVADVTVTGNLLRFAGSSSAERLLTVRNTRLEAGSSLLHLDAGTLTVSSSAPGAALQILNSLAETGTHLVTLVSNSRLVLDRSLLESVDSAVVTRDGAILAAFGDARVSSTSGAPLLQFSSGDGLGGVIADDNFVVLAAAVPGGPAPSMTLAGPLLTATRMNVANGDEETNARSFLSVFDGARLSSSSSQALVSLDRSSLDTTGSLVSVRRSGSAPSTLELAGPLLAAQGSEITVFSTALRDTDNNERLCCSLVGVGQGGRLTSSTASPLIDVSGGSMFLGSRFTVVFDTTSLLGEPTITAPGVVSLAGPLARVVGTPVLPATIVALEDFLGVFRSSLTATTTAPLISLDRAGVVLGGTNPFDGDLTVSGRFLQVAGSATTPSTLSLAGPLLSATDTVITANDDLFAVFGGGRLTSTTTAPLISLTGGSVSAGPIGNFFTFAAAAGVPPPVVTLAGPLLRASGLVLSNGDPTTTSQAFTFVGDGATIRSTSPDPLIELDRTAVVGGTFLTVRRPGATPSMIDLDGPLVRAVDSSISTTVTGQRNANNQPILCCGVLSVGQGATFNSDSPSPLIDLTGTSVITGDRLVTVFETTSVLNEPEIAPMRSFLTLDGPLLRAVSGGGITTRQDLLGIFGSTVTSTTSDALISVQGIPLFLGGISQLDGTQTFGRVLQMNGVAGRPAILQLNGSLFKSADVQIATTADVFSFFNGAQASSTGPNAFIELVGGSVTAAQGATFLGLASNLGQPASTLSLNGPLLFAENTTLVNGNPGGLNRASFVFLGDGATLTASGTNGALLAFTNTSVATAGNIVTVRRSPSAATATTMTLSRPLLAAIDSRFRTPTLSGFFVAEGAQLTATSALPLIELTGSTFNAAAGEQAGFDFFTVTDTDGFTTPPANIFPATVALAGPFLKATRSAVDARPDVLSVTRSTFSSTSTEPLIQMDSSTVNASGSLARVADGKLLAATVSALANVMGNSTLTTGLHAVDVSGQNGAVELKDLIRLTNSLMTVNTGHLAQVNGGRLTVTGNLVGLAGNSTLNILNGLLLNMIGGTANISGSLVSFSGSGNTINVQNNLLPNFFAGGIPIFVQPGTPNPIINGNPLAGLGTNGAINVCNGGTCASLQPGATSAPASLIAVRDGATLTIGR